MVLSYIVEDINSKYSNIFIPNDVIYQQFNFGGWLRNLNFELSNIFNILYPLVSKDLHPIT
jgi:hypothetical protein